MCVCVCVCLCVCMSVCLGDYINNEEVYEDITNPAALKKKMVELLNEYNNSPGVVRMDLVLFRDAIDHGIIISALLLSPHVAHSYIGLCSF